MSRHRRAEMELARALLANLYEEYYDGIVRYIFVRIRDRTEAEDPAGEVFLKALNSCRDELSVEETVEAKLQVERLCKALRQLTPSQRQVIGLRFFAGLSSAEVGEISGESGAALREMRRAAIEKLRKLIW